MTILRLFKTLLFPVILILAGATYPQTGNVYQISIRDENNEIGQYFDIQIDNVGIVSDTTMNFQMIPNLSIQDSTLREKYSTFLEMMKRNTGNELEAVLNQDDIIGILDSKNRSWGPRVKVYIGNEFSGMDDTLRAVFNEFNTKHRQLFGRAYFVEVSQPTTSGWNFDYSNADWRLDRDLTTDIVLDGDGNPKTATFRVSGLYLYENDLKHRLREKITETILLNKNYDKDLVETDQYDDTYFMLSEFSDDLINISRLIGSLSSGNDFNQYLNELNRTPVANPGLTIEAEVGDLVTLDASQSLGLDDAITSYKWTQLFGTKTGTDYMSSNTVELSDSTSVNPSFTPQFPGNYRFLLSVTDEAGNLNERHGDVNITFENNPIEMRGINCWFTFIDSTGFEVYIPELINRLQKTNTEWVEYAPIWYMPTINSNEIRPLWGMNPPQGFTIRDEDLIKFINMLHDANIKVHLRPSLEFDYFVQWRGLLDPPDWDMWFDSYNDFITRYAQIAEQMGVELFSVGNELKNSGVFTGKWRNVISNVREIYSGSLIYNDAGFNYATKDRTFSTVSFWDDLDYIGVDYSLPITGSGPFWDTGMEPQLDPHFETFIARVQENILDVLIPLSLQYDKQIIFTEVDILNHDGANQHQYDQTNGSGQPIDNNEPIKFHEAVLREVIKSDRIVGYYGFLFDMLDGFNHQVHHLPIGWDMRDKPLETALKFWLKDN